MNQRPRRLLPGRLRAAVGVAGRRTIAAALGPLQPAVVPGSVVAICHCHDPELVAELATGLLSLPRGAVLHVSSSRDAVLDGWQRYRGLSRAPIHFHRVENRGRDLLPFFEVARGLALGPDTAVLKIHGKRSTYSDRGDWWRRDIIRGLFPGPFSAHRALARLKADPRLGLIGAPGSFISNPLYWGRNRDAVAAMMIEMTGLASSEDDLGFIAGSMFWIRGGLVSALLPHVHPARFGGEPLDQDGTYAHAVERAIGMAALSWGWHIAEGRDPTPLTRDAVRDRTVAYF